MGGISQSKYATKSNVTVFVIVGVGVGHIPTLNKFAEISGQSVSQGYEPSSKQVPPKEVLKHHLSPV